MYENLVSGASIPALRWRWGAVVSDLCYEHRCTNIPPSIRAGKSNPLNCVVSLVSLLFLPLPQSKWLFAALINSMYVWRADSYLHEQSLMSGISRIEIDRNTLALVSDISIFSIN